MCCFCDLLLVVNGVTVKGCWVIGLMFGKDCAGLKGVEETIAPGEGEIFCDLKDGGGTEKSVLMFVACAMGEFPVLVILFVFIEKFIFGSSLMKPSFLHRRVSFSPHS